MCIGKYLHNIFYLYIIIHFFFLNKKYIYNYNIRLIIILKKMNIKYHLLY